MKQKGLLALMGVTLVAVVVAGLSVGGDDTSAAADDPRGDELFPDLDVNAVAELALEGADAAVTLRKGEAGWSVVERGGYPARFERVKETVVRLSRLKIEEPKTQRPEKHAQLGVQGPDAPDSESRRVVLRDANGTELANAILGSALPRRGAQSLYVRRDGEDQVWLCSGRMDVDADPSSWMDKELLRLESDRVEDVRIQHADGEEVLIGRDPDNHTQFVVENVPPEREVSFPGVANSLGTALTYLSFDDVRPASELAGAEPVARTSYRCHDGLLLEVESLRSDEETWIRLAARYEEPAGADLVGPAPDAEAGEGEAPEPAGDEPDPEAIRAEAEELSARFAEWAFLVPEYKSQVFARRMEALLKALEVEGDDADSETLVEGGEEVDLENLLDQLQQESDEAGLEETEDDTVDEEEPPADSPEDGKS